MACQAWIAVGDDDRSDLAVTCSLLRSIEYRTLVLESASDLLARDLKDVGYIVSGVQMPGGSGLDLQRLLRMRARDPADPHDSVYDPAVTAGAAE